MSTTSQTRATAAALRAELEQVMRQLEAAEGQWAGLDDDPVSFRQRAALAASILDLRRRVAHLPAAIDLAERQEAAIGELRQQAQTLRREAEERLSALLDTLPSRDDLREVLQACSAANAVRDALARHADDGLERPIEGRRALQIALDRVAHDLILLSVLKPPDGSAWRDPVAVLNETAPRAEEGIAS